MKKGLFITIAAIFCCMSFSHAQGTDDESIRKVLDIERQAGEKNDSTVLFGLFTHDPAFSATYIGSGYYSVYRWNDFHSEMAASMKRPVTRKINTVEFSDVKIKSSGDVGTAEFVRLTVDSAKKPVWQSLDTWSFVKDNGNWKINKILSVDTGSFNHLTPMNDAALEQEINMAGYRLLAVKKYDHAIKLLKMNVEIFPKAWNTYDSLGEAYAAAGNKKEAIANYEMSMKLNPDNSNGKIILEKLKKAK